MQVPLFVRSQPQPENRLTVFWRRQLVPRSLFARISNRYSPDSHQQTLKSLTQKAALWSRENVVLEAPVWPQGDGSDPVVEEVFGGGEDDVVIGAAGEAGDAGLGHGRDAAGARVAAASTPVYIGFCPDAASTPTCCPAFPSPPPPRLMHARALHLKLLRFALYRQRKLQTPNVIPAASTALSPRSCHSCIVRLRRT